MTVSSFKHIRFYFINCIDNSSYNEILFQLIHYIITSFSQVLHPVQTIPKETFPESGS